MIEQQAIELIRELFELPTVQLMVVVMLALVLVMAVMAVAMFKLFGGVNKREETQSKFENRLVSLSEAANERQAESNRATQSLATAINALNETQIQTRNLHQQNRDDILDTKTKIEQLHREFNSWHSLNDDTTTALTEKVDTLYELVGGFRTGIEALIAASKNAIGDRELNEAVRQIEAQIGAQINLLIEESRESHTQILEAIRKLTPQPPTPTNEAQQPKQRKPLQADAVKDDATVDSNGEAA